MEKRCWMVSFTIQQTNLLESRTLTSVASKLAMLPISARFFHFYLFCTTTIFMIDKVMWHSDAKSLLSNKQSKLNINI